MEKKIGSALIIVENNNSVSALNEILSRHGDLILGRQGIPLKSKGIKVISIVYEGSTDQIGSLTGQIGKLKGIRVKSLVSKCST